MLTPKKVIDFLVMLDHFDSVTIEENQQGENVTLEAINNVNSGNNCLHFCIIHNGHRIVIQTYKYMNIPGQPIDVVQGKPEIEDEFIDFIDFLNDSRNDFSDQVLNNLFVFYCSTMWQDLYAVYFGEMDSFIFVFDPDDLTVTFENLYNQWIITATKATPEQIRFIINFIDTIENLCK